jgi:DNA-directed RNA polymerase subunit RPC12/RpoP
MELGAGRQAMFAYLHSGKAMAACDYCTSRVLTKTIPPAIQIKKGA